MEQMTAEGLEGRVVRRGVHKHYEWLTCTGDVYMGTVLNACPELVLSRYVAVPSIDSGVLRLSEENLLAGWTARGGIGYSPVVTALDQLEYQRDISRQHVRVSTKCRRASGVCEYVCICHP